MGAGQAGPHSFLFSEVRLATNLYRTSFYDRGFYRMIRRMTIGLSPHDRGILRHLYLEFRIPSDQYQRRPQDLARFVRRWNALTERNDSPGDILHYIITNCKNSEWVKLGGDHKRLNTMPEAFLVPEGMGNSSGRL